MVIQSSMFESKRFEMLWSSCLDAPNGSLSSSSFSVVSWFHFSVKVRLGDLRLGFSYKNPIHKSFFPKHKKWHEEETRYEKTEGEHKKEKEGDKKEVFFH